MKVVWGVFAIVAISVIGYTVFVEFIIPKDNLQTTGENGVIITTDRTEYLIEEPVTITMKNTGTNTLQTSGTPTGFALYDKHDKLIQTWHGVTGMMGQFSPQEEVTHVWDQKDESGNQVEVGRYFVKADNFSPYLDPMPTHSFDIVQEQSWCESKGGKWSEESKLCVGIDSLSCVLEGGKHNSCDSRTIDESGNVIFSPVDMCVETCQFD